MTTDDAPLVRLQVKCSEGMIDALGTYANVNKLSVSDVVRLAIATTIGYDMGKPVERRGRKAKYNTPEARREAARLRSQTERAIQSELSKSYSTEERRRVVERMRKSLGQDNGGKPKGKK